ncbi:type 4a pilus biogenesis protein PilO [Thiopseudomonas denitrificans]|uniref:Type IV pilus assembly protein PilO n=1 Tax=Thiopseudomonas denitrificans TaxID=1501432 RepID=A0A4R6TW34_9GAMM|nr:type 4a pilus biogenesis protein PilO [Thiopseudomonas denitrificans]TDQ35486.1 type IV pilus assembly protein PilO [Thiopseudomonas denitrificans]
MSLKDSLKSLNEIDFNDLDLNNLGSWPAPVKVISAILLLVIVLVAGYFMHVQDLQDELTRQQAEEVTLKQQFESKVRQAANLEAYKEQMVLMEASFDKLLRQLPSDTEVPGLLEDITSAGLNSGLEFEEIRLLQEVAQQFYIELPIQIKVVGGYHELATFVSAVASMPRIVTLHDFQIVPDKSGSASRLAMNIQVKTYRYNDQGQAR